MSTPFCRQIHLAHGCHKRPREKNKIAVAANAMGTNAMACRQTPRVAKAAEVL
ncbi:hypothetical protein LJR290_007277 [Variovorax sp. LjRoot290]